MKLRFFGREVHMDLSKKGEPWDLSVFLHQTEVDGDGVPSVKGRIVPYYVSLGILRPKAEGRNVLHLVFLRLMVTVYGKTQQQAAQ